MAGGWRRAKWRLAADDRPERIEKLKEGKMKVMDDCRRILRRAGEKLRERFVRGIRAARSFSVPAWCGGIIQELREELTPFSWRRGLRYYRRPLVVLLVFCILWSVPVVLANTAGTTLFYWWPDYVTIPVNTKHIVEYQPLRKKKYSFSWLNYERARPSEYVDYSYRNGGGEIPPFLRDYSSIKNYTGENGFSEHLEPSDVMIVCKAEVVDTRVINEYQWIDYHLDDLKYVSLYRTSFWFRMLLRANGIHSRSEMQANAGGLQYQGDWLVTRVRIEEVFFDPYDIYEEGEEYLLEMGIYFPALGDRVYLFLTYPRYSVRHESFYNMGLVDSSEHYNTWYIKDGNVFFRENAFPIRSDVKELRNTYEQNGKKYYEIYTEEEIDRFLRENLTVQEDLWRAYVEENLR